MRAAGGPPADLLEDIESNFQARVAKLCKKAAPSLETIRHGMRRTSIGGWQGLPRHASASRPGNVEHWRSNGCSAKCRAFDGRVR
jgi:hypothetical protein